MAGRLDGKVALVTGGTRGIGEAIAEAFVREGATTIIASRKQDNVDAAVARLSEATGRTVHGMTLHMGEPDRIVEVVDAITSAHGPIDVLVNNAATNPYFGPMVGVTWPAWDKTFQVNVMGAFALTQAVCQRLMDAGKPGSVISLSSILGIQAAPMQGVYGMTKAAILSMTRTLAMELGPAGIRFNAIAPGLVDTKFASTLVETPELLAMFEGRTALKRIAQPPEIAGAAVWLASDESAYVTGSTVTVDGGYTIS